jgi:hypothetical protein
MGVNPQHIVGRGLGGGATCTPRRPLNPPHRKSYDRGSAIASSPPSSSDTGA